MLPTPSYLKQMVDESNPGIEAKHVHRIGDEIRKSVHIVEVVPAVAIIDEILDPADIEARMSRDRLDLLDDVRRWCVRFDAKARLRRVQRASAAHELHALFRLASVGGAKVMMVASGSASSWR